jgi:mannose-6-phosphate isomerase-like protein (cupin superfamily)
VGWHVVHGEDLEWVERDTPGAEVPRRHAVVTEPARLRHSRSRMWHYPPGTRGRRHRDHAQEEVFVVVSGTLTMLLGDPPERIEAGPLSVVAVEPMTALQVRNESDADLFLYVYGAPPEQAGADFLDDVALRPKR